MTKQELLKLVQALRSKPLVVQIIESVFEGLRRLAQVLRPKKRRHKRDDR